MADREALENQRLNDPSLDHITAIDELFADQLDAADLVLISRADLVTEESMDSVRSSLESQVRAARRAKMPLYGRVTKTRPYFVQ